MAGSRGIRRSVSSYNVRASPQRRSASSVWPWAIDCLMFVVGLLVVLSLGALSLIVMLLLGVCSTDGLTSLIWAWANVGANTTRPTQHRTADRASDTLR